MTDYRLPSPGAYERLEPYAGKPARTVLRGEWRSNALFLPDRPGAPNGNGAQAEAEAAANGSTVPEGGETTDPDMSIPF